MKLTIAGRLLVGDLLKALSLESVPQPSKLDREDWVDFDDVEIKSEDAIEALDQENALPIFDHLREGIHEADLRTLAEAIRTADRPEAERAMDRMFGHDPQLREWVDQGRYSSKARKAKSVTDDRVDLLGLIDELVEAGLAAGTFDDGGPVWEKAAKLTGRDPDSGNKVGLAA